MVREMLADIAIGIYAGEALVYRTVGHDGRGARPTSQRAAPTSRS